MEERKLTLTFGAEGYIAHPYWPEMERWINITKESGMARTRSGANRDAALNAHLRAIDMTREQYDELVRLAHRHWYTWNDVLNPEEMDGHDPQEIVVPAHQLYGALAQAADEAPAAVRFCKGPQVRTVFHVTDLGTGKTKADGVWERFAVVTGGAGNKLSNQRALRTNEYIANFSASGTLSWTGNRNDEDKIARFLEYTGRTIGIGASRKMGRGRFEVTLE
jgi:hypothetical protein